MVTKNYGHEKKTIIRKTNIWTPTHLFIQDILTYILLIFVNIINYFLSTLSDAIVGKWYSASRFGKKVWLLQYRFMFHQSMFTQSLFVTNFVTTVLLKIRCQHSMTTLTTHTRYLPGNPSTILHYTTFLYYYFINTILLLVNNIDIFMCFRYVTRFVQHTP